MDLLPGDVVLVEVRFHQAPGAKVRPAVVVLDSAMRTLLALRSPRGDARPNSPGTGRAGKPLASMCRRLPECTSSRSWPRRTSAGFLADYQTTTAHTFAWRSAGRFAPLRNSLRAPRPPPHLPPPHPSY